MAIEIIATGRAIPAKRLTNDDLANRLDTTDEWIRSHTGIGARYVAEEGVAASDLALEAARNALAMAAEQTGTAVETLAQSLDVIILGSTSPDYYGVPATACIVQDKLGAKNAAAMDITAACTGFIYGLEVAAGLLTVDRSRKRALVIGAEVLSRIVDWNDRGTAVLFGDGAGAVLIERTETPSEGKNRRGVLRTILRADGSGAERLRIKQGGSRYPYQSGGAESPPHVEMDGRMVYNFAVKAITGTIEKLLTQENITINDVARIIPHQANARIIQAAGKRLGIPESKFFLNIEEYANTSAASIPIALDELNRTGRLKQGDLIMTVGFGGGLTYGGNLIIW
ncbi:MAG: ketoacyl-ACP synthase III [Spirochaetaceae bacterium]|jgi:3-oxoacyl-[acyl-carrier-protein] synthase-3|nr:ketoacyl-ACP synthase III [Spirochaetaceae bacterium]